MGHNASFIDLLLDLPFVVLQAIVDLFDELVCRDDVAWVDFTKPLIFLGEAFEVAREQLFRLCQ